ncbi:MAG: FtsX-like permease family protein [Candidatus Bathyarchaeota archaeon]|nr:FtsX-like permease family protein [Candidatus Bathyarchaeota archaeon]
MCGTTIALRSIPLMIEATIEEANMADFSLSTGILSRDIVEQILSKKDYIEQYELRLTYKTIAYNPRGWPREVDMLLIGADLPLKMNNVTIVRGRMPEGYEIIVEHDYGENVLERQISIETIRGNVTVKVVGTCRAIWMPRWYGSSVAYAIIPIQVLREMLNGDNIVNQILVKIKREYNVFEAMKELNDEIKSYRVPVSKSIEGNVIPFIETKSYYSYLVSLLSLIGLSIFAISLALIYTSTNLMVTREFKDIGILRAIGASNRSILFTYSLRGLIIGVIGGFLGSFLGIIAARALLSGFANVSLIMEGVYFVISSLPDILNQNISLIMFYTITGILCSIISTIPPIIYVNKIPVIQAIKSFPGLLATDAKIKIKIERYPYFVRYALRSISRKKNREIIITIVIAVSVTINSTLISAYEAQHNILNETSSSLNFDLILCLNRPYDISLLMSKVKPLIDNISNLEFAYYRYVKVGKYTILSVGLPANASCFNYPLVNGRYLTSNESGVILSENLARTLNAKVGDNVTLVTEKLNLNLTVVGIRRDLVFNFLVVPIHIMQKLDDSEYKVNAMIIKFKENSNINDLTRVVRRSIPGYLFDINKSGVIDILSDVLTETFQSAATVMIIFTWLTSILLIFTIAGQDIIEERIVIATLRALGMSRLRGISFIIFKLLVLGGFSALLCLFTIPITLTIFSGFLSGITPFSISIYPSPSVLFNAIFFILSTIIPSGLILGGYLVSVNIASALRYE